MILKNYLKVLCLLFVTLMLSCNVEDGEDGINGTDGINGVNGVDGQDGVDGRDGVSGGVTNLILSGDISDEEARIKIENTLGADTQFVIIRNTTNLTTVNLSGLSEVIGIDVKNNSELLDINFSNISSIIDELDIQLNPKLNSIEFPDLRDIGRADILNDMTTEIRMPVLKNVFTQMLIKSSGLTLIDFSSVESGTFDFQDNNLSEINLSKLVNGLISIRGSMITDINLSGFENGTVLIDETSVTSLDFPSLKDSTFIRFTNNRLLTEVNFPVLDKATDIILEDNNIEIFNFPSTIDFQLIEIEEDTDLPVSFVNEFLNKLVSINPSITGKEIRIAAFVLTGQGIIDVQTLRANGNIVFTDFNI